MKLQAIALGFSIVKKKLQIMRSKSHSFCSACWFYLSEAETPTSLSKFS